MTRGTVKDTTKAGQVRWLIRALCLSAGAVAILWGPWKEEISVEALTYLVLIGGAYILLAVFSPLRKLPRQWMELAVTVFDVSFITVLVIMTGGVWSVYQLFYILPVADSARRREGRGTIEGLALVAAGYGVMLGLGVASLEERSLTPKRVLLALAAIGILIAWLRSIQQENWAKRQLERLREDLAAMLVHDLKNPLTTIIGTLQLLKEGALGPLETEQEEFMDMALQGSNTLLEMVSTLLDIGRLEEAKFPLDVSETDLRALIEGALEEVKVSATQQGVELSSRVPSSIPPVSADQAVLRRVLTNLLGNAIKFTPNGGRVAVSTAFREGEGGVVVTVSDTGQGIPKDYHEKIFEKFGQVELRKRGGKAGAGLGLSFCKLAIEGHGGRIWVESEEGKGTRMSFFLPCGPRKDT